MNLEKIVNDMDKITKVRQEIERQMNFYDGKEREVLDDPKQFTYALFYQGHQKMCAKLLSFLDTLSEEPDKSLEEAAEEYAREYTNNDNGNGGDDWEDDIKITFKAGGKWKEEQIMKNAKDGWIDEECVIVLNDDTRIDLQPDYDKKPAFEFEYAQDVRVIVLPKEDKK